MLGWLLGSSDDNITAAHWGADSEDNSTIRTDVSINGNYHPDVSESSWQRLNRVVQFTEDTSDSTQTQDTGKRRGWF